MKWLTRWFLDNPVAANLLMAFIVVAGFLTFDNLRVESFPSIPPNQLSITVAYPGGTPEQVDEGITQRIEEAISGVAGIKSVRSESHRGFARVTVKKNTSIELERLMQDIRNELEGIIGFPEKAEKPRIYRDEFSNLAAFVMVFGGADPDLLQTVSNRIETALKKHPVISKVQHQGQRKKQIIIEPYPDTLQRYDLTIEALAQSIQKWSLEYRSGELDTARGAIVLNGGRYADNVKALQDLPIINTANAVLRLSDLAEVRSAYQQNHSLVRYQGEQAVALMVNTSQKDNLFRVSEAIKEVEQALVPTLPQDIKLAVVADMTPYISEQLNLLGNNAWQGLLIVIVILGLFLEWRLAFWVALGIPVSLAGAIALMGLPVFDYSINDITLFGMILVLGVLVDDAVVVGESIYQARQTHADRKQAAWKGVEEVAVATVFGVLTTIAAFSPMLWIENELAKVLAGFSAVVIFALLFSLVESKFILPVHLAMAQSDNSRRNIFSRWAGCVRTHCDNGLQYFSEKIYQPLLKTALTNKLITLLLFCSFMMLAYGLLTKGHIRSVFFPEIPGRYATLEVTMDQDATKALTLRNSKQIEQALQTTNKQLRDEYTLAEDPVSKTIVAVIGQGYIELTAEITAEALATIPSSRFLSVWREQVGYVEGSYSLKFRFSEELAGGTAIAVAAPRRDMARRVAREIKGELARLPGVNDVYDDSQGGKRQLNIRLNERGMQLGIDQRELAALVGGAFGDIEVYRLLDDNQETTVLLQFPEQKRKTIEQLKTTPVQVANKHFVSLGEISEFEYTRAAEVIYRRNRDEVVSIYWRQNRSISSPESNWERLQKETLPTLLAQYPGVTVSAVGEFSEITEVQTGFKTAMILTLLLVYVLLAIPLKSYWQPLIIMSVIPFGFAGAIMGHAFMGLSFSLLSMFGLMAMTGVVINDSLVLITRFNQLYLGGYSLRDALVKAGRSRIRAIFLTTVTTVCGLLPLLSENSEQAQYLKPAAASLVFGELFATPITLILIPVLLATGKYQTHTRFKPSSADGSGKVVPNSNTQ